MARSSIAKTNFDSGVISPKALAREDVTYYHNALQVGSNIQIGGMGEMSRRPGTEFIRDYGNIPYMRIYPFIFNQEQQYIIVLRLDEVDEGVYDGYVDIYRDDVLVASIITPYDTADKIKELDFAQSADVMILTHGSIHPQLLRRLGSDAIWDLIDVPFVNEPCLPMTCVNDTNPDDIKVPICPDDGSPNCQTGECYDEDNTLATCGTGYTLTSNPLWTDENGYPKHCTFHQGRLWFANTLTRPQSVWASSSSSRSASACGSPCHARLGSILRRQESYLKLRRSS